MWYNFAEQLVGTNRAEMIKYKYYGDSCHSCLQELLVLWYDSTTDHSWQVIIDALTEIEAFPVIESIEKHCLSY